MKRTTGWLLGVWLLWGALGEEPVWSQDAEPYLQGPQGPYRGKVVDARTGTTIPGALVLVVWQEDHEGRPVTFAAREAQTDAEGSFRIDGTDVEARPPLFALPPRLVIFAHSYFPLPEVPRWPLGEPSGRFRGQGNVVRLRPTGDEEERIIAFNAFISIISGFQLFGDVDKLNPPLHLLGRVWLKEMENFGFRQCGRRLVAKEVQCE